MLSSRASACLRQGRDNENLQQRAILAESARRLLKHPWLDKAEDFRRVREHGGAECLGEPALDDDNRALDRGQVRRPEHKRERPGGRLGMGVEDEEVNIVVILAVRLADVFAVLAHEELVQLEVFADDGFADSRHVRWRVDG